MKKGIASILIIVLLAAAMVGLFYYTGQYLPAPAGSLTGASVLPTGCTAKEGLLVIPVVGYYECKQTAETCDQFVVPASINLLDTYRLYCDVFAPNCRFEEQVAGGSVTTISHGQYIDVSKKWVSRTWNRCYTPYSLWLESNLGSSGWVSKSKYSCNLFDYMLSAQAYCIKSSLASDLGGSSCDADKLYKSTTLDFDQNTNFLEGWISAPYEMNIKDHPIYGKVYCASDGMLYDLGTIETKTGCYAYPKTYLGKVDCCPGQILGATTCGSDFHWKTVVTTECISDYQCTGQGAWAVDYSDVNRRTAIKFACVSGKCTPQTKQTICTTNEACATGLICMLDKNTGNGECVSSGQVSVSPRTPTVTLPNNSASLMDWLLSLITSFIIAGILIGAAMFLGLYISPLKVLTSRFFNLKYFAIATVILGLIIFSLYAGFVLSVKASIFG
jgi:hypothetical protein